jgi:phenylpropionate dioxygenase-like ring-hydroxylating dioxygenase large terminal subunit
MAQIADPRPINEIPALPDVADFPSHPGTWYLFCRTDELRAKPISKTILQRRLVAYRTAVGHVSVLDANCAHLGADLGRGAVIGDEIQCPFHHWRYAPSGKCVATAQDCHTLPLAALRSYPAVERHGYVFFFFGPRPTFPLPFFTNCDPAKFVASSPFRFEMDCPWYMLVANGFDTQHFHAVHDRKLTSTPQVDCPSSMARRMRFDAEVTGNSIFDRLLKRFIGREVQISITSWGGPHVLVEGVFGKAHSRLLVASQPLDESHTLSEVIVFAKRSRGPLKAVPVDRLNLRVRRRFTQAFMQYDINKLAGVRYRPEGLTPHDRDMIEFFQWLTTLPRSEYEAER